MSSRRNHISNTQQLKLKKTTAIKPESLLFWGFVLALVLLAVLPLNSRSSLTLNHTFFIHIRLDHLFHGMMFLPWVLIALKFKKMSIPSALVSGLLMAMMIEGIQYFLPYRAYNINDMLSNLIGVTAGSFVLFFKWDK